MLKLKNILSELDLRRRKLKPSSKDRFVYTFSIAAPLSIIPNNTSLIDIRYLPKLKQYIDKHTIYSSGDIRVTRQVKGTGVYYFILDISTELVVDGIIGYMETTPIDYKMSTMKINEFFKLKGEVIHYSSLREEFIGKGYGKLLYDTVLNHVGVLLSDTTLFQGSYKLWANHVPKKSQFFGVSVSTTGGATHGVPILIPIDITKISSSWLTEDGGNYSITNFIAINNGLILPKSLRQLAHNLTNINPSKDLVVLGGNYSFTLGSDFKSSYVDKTTGAVMLLYDNPINTDSDDATLVDTETLDTGYTVEDYIENFNTLKDFISASTNIFRNDFKLRIHLNPKTLGNAKVAIIVLRDSVLIVREVGGNLVSQILT